QGVGRGESASQYIASPIAAASGTRSARPMREDVAMIRRLSPDDARRMAVRAQLRDAPRPDHVAHVVDRLPAPPVAPTAVFGPTPDFILWSRIGAGYDRNELQVALDGRELWEHGGFIRPMDDLALFLAEMERSPARESTRRWLDDNADFQFDVVQL